MVFGYFKGYGYDSSVIDKSLPSSKPLLFFLVVPSLFKQFEILVENRRFLMKMKVKFQFSTLPKKSIFWKPAKKISILQNSKKMSDQGQHRQGLLGLVLYKP